MFTSAPGSATEYEDFLPQAGSLDFLPGVASQTISVALVPDSLPEGPETFFVNLTSVTLLDDK